MRLCICMLLMVLAAPLCGQTVVRDTNYTALQRALIDHIYSNPIIVKNEHPTDLVLVNGEIDSQPLRIPPPSRDTLNINGEELIFSYLKTRRHTLEAYTYFRYDTANCAVLIAEKIERYNITHWPDSKWQEYVRKNSHGEKVIDDSDRYITCDTVERAVIVHTIEPLLAVRTEDAWKVYSEPPELFRPDWDMQYFFEQRWQQQRDKLMERYRKRNRECVRFTSPLRR